MFSAIFQLDILRLINDFVKSMPDPDILSPFKHIFEFMRLYSCMFKEIRNNLCSDYYDNSTFSFILFACLQVDMAALRQMGESDLKDMGVPMVGSKFTEFLFTSWWHISIPTEKQI